MSAVLNDLANMSAACKDHDIFFQKIIEQLSNAHFKAVRCSTSLLALANCCDELMKMDAAIIHGVESNSFDQKILDMKEELNSHYSIVVNCMGTKKDELHPYYLMEFVESIQNINSGFSQYLDLFAKENLSKMLEAINASVSVCDRIDYLLVQDKSPPKVVTTRSSTATNAYQSISAAASGVSRSNSSSARQTTLPYELAYHSYNQTVGKNQSGIGDHIDLCDNEVESSNYIPSQVGMAALDNKVGRAGNKQNHNDEYVNNDDDEAELDGNVNGYKAVRASTAKTQYPNLNQQNNNSQQTGQQFSQRRSVRATTAYISNAAPTPPSEDIESSSDSCKKDDDNEEAEWQESGKRKKVQRREKNEKQKISKPRHSFAEIAPIQFYNNGKIDTGVSSHIRQRMQSLSSNVVDMSGD